MDDYDHSIHTNPDALAWAKFFVETVNRTHPTIDEDFMLGWFANAMMAMHDHTVRSFPRPPQEEGTREALRAVADAFEGSVLLHDMTDEERAAIETAFCVARGLAAPAPAPQEEGPVRVPPPCADHAPYIGCVRCAPSPAAPTCPGPDVLHDCTHSSPSPVAPPRAPPRPPLPVRTSRTLTGEALKEALERINPRPFDDDEPLPSPVAPTCGTCGDSCPGGVTCRCPDLSCPCMRGGSGSAR
jgi:hypothetical protein